MSVLVAALLLAGAAALAAETVVVAVKKTSVRRDRQFYAPTITEATLGEAFTVFAREKGWVKVGTGSGEGWLHESAVSAKKVAASAQAPAGGKIDAQDVALAGKGFTRRSRANTGRRTRRPTSPRSTGWRSSARARRG